MGSQALRGSASAPAPGAPAPPLYSGDSAAAGVDAGFRGPTPPPYEPVPGVPGPASAVTIGASILPGDPVGQLIREARLARGLTQGELARRAGLVQSNVSRFEHDEVSPSISMLARIANAAGYDLEVSLVTRSSVDAAGASIDGTVGGHER